MTGIYLHINSTSRHRSAKMREMWGFLQFYPGAVFNTTSNQITVPDVMVHVFLLDDFEFDKIAGLPIKGYDIEYHAKVSQKQYDYIRSRVRGTP